MREIVAEDQPFVREELSRDEGLQRFADQPYKVEIIEGVEPDEGAGGSEVSVYTQRTTRAGPTCAGAPTCPPPAGSGRSSS